MQILPAGHKSMTKERKEVIEYIKYAIEHGVTPAVMACNLHKIFARQFNELLEAVLPKNYLDWKQRKKEYAGSMIEQAAVDSSIWELAAELFKDIEEKNI